MSELLAVLQHRTFARATAATVSSYPAERRLDAAQLASYLDRRAFAVVGSTRAGGRPHAAMSSYVRRDATFWLPTVAGSVRERNLRDTPWLTLVIAEGGRAGARGRIPVRYAIDRMLGWGETVTVRSRSWV